MTDPKPFLINVLLKNITAKNHIMNKFDFEVTDQLYEQSDNKGTPIVYEFLYKYIKRLNKINPVITFSPDQAISASIISSLNEKNIEDGISKLKIIYITSRPHIQPLSQNITCEGYMNSIISNLMGNTQHTFTNHQTHLDSSQFVLIGINDDLILNNEKELLCQSGLTFYTLKRINKIGLQKIIDSIKSSFGDSPIHVVFDMSVMDSKTAPCVTRFMHNEGKIVGLDLKHLDLILNGIKTMNIKSLDVTGYDLRYEDTDIAYRITCETARRPLSKLFNFKDKTLNIFNENTKFLVWRPLYQSSDVDIGWYILRGLTLKQREKYLSDLTDDAMRIETIPDGDDDIDVLISSTTIAEQEDKNYILAESIKECTLFCDEKTNMMFELLNSYPDKLNNSN